MFGSPRLSTIVQILLCSGAIFCISSEQHVPANGQWFAGNGFPISQRHWKDKLIQSTDCGEDLFFDQNGEILSPNYPEEYPPNTDCQWGIYAEFGTKIKLHFVEFSIDPNPNCRSEYLEIKDFDSETLHCGGATLPDLVSQGNSLLITFKSDDAVAGSGNGAVRRFRIMFTLDDGSGEEDLCDALPSNPCLNGGVCVDNSDSGFTCDCQENFSGDYCQCAANACESVDCGFGGICIDVDGCSSTMCICDTGFVQAVNGTCVDLNECLQFDPCHPDATCTNSLGSFECNCNDGFVGDGIESCLPEETGVCPEDWRTYVGSSSCYRVTDGVYSGDSKEVACESMHHSASPVCVQSKEEMNFISTLVPTEAVNGNLSSAASWLGISHDPKRCLSGEPALTPTPWFPGQPDDAGPCVYARPYKLATRTCYREPSANDPSALPRQDWYFGLCETTRMCWDVNICPPGFETLGTSCYAVLDEASNFDQARVGCQALDIEADLAILTDETELLTVMGSEVISAGGPYWVGLVFVELQNEYQWIDGSGPLGYNAWMDSSEPSILAAEGCGIVAKSHWGDAVCDVEYNVICEMPMP